MAKEKSKPDKPLKKTNGSVKKKVVKKIGPTKTSVKKPAKKVLVKKVKTLPAKKKATKKRKPETLMCFLTTACVNYYDLQDNCYELTTLRNYRDTYLSATDAGKKLIRDYYAVAPEIVDLANKDKAKESVYKYIFAQVKKACREIEANHLLSAKKTYIKLVKTLSRRYHSKLSYRIS